MNEYFPKVLSAIIQEYAKVTIHFLKRDRSDRSRLYITDGRSEYTVTVNYGNGDTVMIFPIINRYILASQIRDSMIGTLDGKLLYDIKYGFGKILFATTRDICSHHYMINIEKRVMMEREITDHEYILGVDFNNSSNYLLHDTVKNKNKYYVDGKYRGHLIHNGMESSVIMGARYIIINNKVIDMNTTKEYSLGDKFIAVCFFDNETVIGIFKNRRHLFAINLRTKNIRTIYKRHKDNAFVDYVKFNKSRWCMSIIMRAQHGHVGVMIYSLDNVQCIDISNTLDFWVM